MKPFRRSARWGAVQRARRSTVPVLAALGLAIGLGGVPVAQAAAVGEDVAAWVEVEDGVISGGPAYNSGDHSNFSGEGSYTFRESGMRSTMAVTVPEAGVYPIYVRYSAGPLSAAENVTRSMGLIVNGTRQQLAFPMTADWETWRFVEGAVTLNQGVNTIALDCDRNVDMCRLNFDAIQIGGAAADPCAATPPSAGYRSLFDGTFASFDGWRKAGSGGFGRQVDCTIRSIRGRGAEWFTQQQAAPYTLMLDWRREAADDESSLYLASSSRGGADPVGGFRIPIGADTGAVVPTGGTMQPADQTAVTRALRPVGEWNRYVVQVTGSQVRVYLNGMLVNTYDSPQAIAANGFIGLENRGAGHVVDFKDIQIADGAVPDPDGGVSFVPVHYEFEEGSGATAANTGSDSSVGPATLTGATGWSESGVYGSALELPGGSNANTVDLPDNLLQGEDAFTTSFWVRPDTKGNWINLFHIGDGLENAGSFFQVQMRTENGTRGLAATFKAKGSDLQERVQAAQADDVVEGEWNHVVFTRQGATGRLYLNGEQIAVRDDLTIDMTDVGPTSNNWLGRNGYPDPAFDGLMDDVRIYESSLTAQDVTALYADGTALETTTTVTVDPASPSPHDAPLTVSATVADENDGAAQGQAELWVDGARVGAPVDATEGAVEFPELTLAPGAHRIEVRFLGAPGWQSSSAVTTHTVRRPPLGTGAPIHYTFDEGQGATAANTGTDSSVGPATLQGDASWVAGQYDDAVSLPGGPAGPVEGSSHVDLPDDITAGMDAELTVSTWIRPAVLPNWTTHLQLGKSTEEFFLLQSSTENGDRGFAATLRVNNGEQYRIQLPGETDLPLDQWTHVVVTLAPSPSGPGTTGKIYFDGVLMEGGTRDNIPVDIGDVGEGGTTANFIGNGSWNDPRPTESVDEFRMYGYELTAEQVAELYATSPNAAPVGAADAYGTVEGEVLAVDAPGVLANDTDAEGDTLTATGLTQPAHGVVTLAEDGSFTYTPAAGFFGTDTFTYTASDGTASSAAATVTITVQEAEQPPVNAAPVAGPDAYDAVQGESLVLPAPGVLVNDTDADGQVLTATGASRPGHGAVTLGANGSFTYTPDAGFSGTDTFTYRASDGEDVSAPATVTITVKPASTGGGDGPVASAVVGVALPITYGQTGSVSVTVSPETAAGTVELRRGSRLLAAAAVAEGRATVALAAESLPVGEHVLTLRYGGDASHRASSSDVTVLVEERPARKAKSWTVVRIKPKTLSYKEDFKVVTKVASRGGATPMGKVEIRIDGKRVKVGKLDKKGRYVLKVQRNLNVGRHWVSVTYKGDSATWWSKRRQWFWVR